MSRPSLPPKTVPVWTQQVMTDDGDIYTYELANNLGYTRGVLRVFADTEVATATLDIKLQAYHDVEAAWYDIPGASLAQITANASVSIDLVIGVGLTAVANRVVSQVLPKRIRVHATCGDATGDGFTVNAEFEFLP
jgi:hypothetical protein